MTNKQQSICPDPPWIVNPPELEGPVEVICAECYGNGVQYAGILNGFETCEHCDGEKYLDAADCDDTFLEDGEWYGRKAG